MNAMSLIYVMAGGALGSALRYLAILWIVRMGDNSFPYGTFFVNVLGSFLMGVWVAIIATMPVERGRDLHLLFAVGLLGGFTTFSAFSIDAFMLLERGDYTASALYIIGSVALSIAALFAGMVITKAIL
jgi:CrcB protein